MATKASHPTEWAVFEQIDKNGDGELSSAEFYDALENFGCATAAATLLKEMDRNQDGNICFDEFVVGFAKLMGKEPSGETSGVVKPFGGLSHQLSARLQLMGANDEDIAMVREDFNSIDVDGSGEITVEEMKKMMMEQTLGGGPPPTEDEVAALIQEYDADGNKSVNFEEYVSKLYNLQEQRNSETAVPEPTEPAAASAPEAESAPPPAPAEEELPQDVKLFDGLSQSTCVQLAKVAATDDDIEFLREDFRSIDTDNSGEISVEELRKMLAEQMMGGEAPSAEEVDAAMAEYDMDGNKSVSFEEYVIKLYNFKEMRSG